MGGSGVRPEVQVEQLAGAHFDITDPDDGISNTGDAELTMTVAAPPATATTPPCAIRELVHRYRFATRADAKIAIEAWIRRYNNVRLSLGSDQVLHEVA